MDNAIQLVARSKQQILPTCRLRIDQGQRILNQASLKVKPSEFFYLTAHILLKRFARVKQCHEVENPN